MSRLPPFDPAWTDAARRAVHDRKAAGARESVGGPVVPLPTGVEPHGRVERLGVVVRHERRVPMRPREPAILAVGAHRRAACEVGFAGQKRMRGSGLTSGTPRL